MTWNNQFVRTIDKCVCLRTLIITVPKLLSMSRVLTTPFYSLCAFNKKVSYPTGNTSSRKNQLDIVVYLYYIIPIVTGMSKEDLVHKWMRISVDILSCQSIMITSVGIPVEILVRVRGGSYSSWRCSFCVIRTKSIVAKNPVHSFSMIGRGTKYNVLLTSKKRLKRRAS